MLDGLSSTFIVGHLQGEMEEPTPSKLRVPLYQGSSSAENWEESLEELITCPMTYYVRFCVVLIIELLPTLSLLSIISGTLVLLE